MIEKIVVHYDDTAAVVVVVVYPLDVVESVVMVEIVVDDYLNLSSNYSLNDVMENDFVFDSNNPHYFPHYNLENNFHYYSIDEDYYNYSSIDYYVVDVNNVVVNDLLMNVMNLFH